MTKNSARGTGGKQPEQSMPDLVLFLEEELGKKGLRYQSGIHECFERFLAERLEENAQNINSRLFIREAAEAIRLRQMERLKQADSVSTESLAEIRFEDIPLKNKHLTTEELLEKLENFKGLFRVKHRIRNIAQAIEMRKFREKRGIAGEPLAIHLILTGGSFEERLSLVMLIGELFCSMGFLSSAEITVFFPGRLPEEDRRAVQDACRDAAGAVLLIETDKSGALPANSGAALFPEHAAAELAAQIEAGRGKFTAILSGRDEDIQKILEKNPVLKDVFTRTLELDG
jgi:hypothetical protein